MNQSSHKDLEALFIFFQKQRENLPDNFTHGKGIINQPSFFTIKDFQKHLSNPLLRPEWAHVKVNGARVEVEKSFFCKKVQSRELQFIDKTVIDTAINNGAAVVLEGLDILDSQINGFVAKLDEALPCVIANSVVFFSQSDNEAYSGHLDVDDVLVVQLEGKKTWQLFNQQQRRYENIADLSEQVLGPVQHEITMNPGDALYLRAGVPHRCQTPEPYSLHMSFDLCDGTPNTSEIARESIRRYNHACEAAYMPATQVVDRYVSVLKSDEFQASLSQATQAKRDGFINFRKMIGRSSAVHSLDKYISER